MYVHIYLDRAFGEYPNVERTDMFCGFGDGPADGSDVCRRQRTLCRALHADLGCSAICVQILDTHQRGPAVFSPLALYTRASGSLSSQVRSRFQLVRDVAVLGARNSRWKWTPQ